MKNLFLIGALLFVVACGNRKETAQEVEAVQEEVTETMEEAENAAEEVEEAAEEVVEEVDQNYRIIGVVHVDHNDCPLYIEAHEKNETLIMYPMNLEAKYKREGVRIKFAYTKSRGQQPENCDIDMVVALSDVTLMR